MKQNATLTRSQGHPEVTVIRQGRRKLFEVAKPYMVFLPWTRHAQVLLAAGFTYFGIGLTYITAEPSRAREHALRLALQWFPIQIWGIIFASIGLLVMISARWPPVTKKWGYVLLTGMAAGWSATYVMGVLFDHSPPQNLSGALLWANFAFMWYIISGLTEHSKPGDDPPEPSEGTYERD